jgi:DNA (cytosine-5)-methyltransferase 1
MSYLAVDLFSGCGGLSEGMRRAGFDVIVAIDINADAVSAYRMNHPNTIVFNEDIRNVDTKRVKDIIANRTLQLLTGCPPCQGFSGVRRLNKKNIIRDQRNRLILDYLRFVDELRPLTIMMENVLGLAEYYLFSEVVRELKKIGYYIDLRCVDAKDYGVPQRRKRLVLVGSLLGKISVKEPTGEKVTVRDAIGNLDSIEETNDPLHKITANHTQRIRELIALIPKNGGSRKDLPDKYILDCHLGKDVGFCDIYGRLKWDDYSVTITGGCLNPSKGRFLHPEENRVITPREAALLQSFPSEYRFPLNISKTALATMIGEALPPKFSYIQCKNIRTHLDMSDNG